MGVHTYGDISSAFKRLIDTLDTATLERLCVEWNIDTTDYLGSDDYDYFRQKLIDDLASVAKER